MTTETTSPNTLESEAASFGWRLQSARASLSLEIKDIAAQLRLNEAVILMLEKDYLSSSLPTTFVRGYLRAYSKLLHIPDIELAQALELLKPKAIAPSTPQPSLSKRQHHLNLTSLTNRHYTLFIVTAFISLIGAWWYTHTTTTPVDIAVAQNQLRIPAEPSVTVNLGAKQTANNIASNITPAKVIATKTDSTDDDEVDETD